MNLFYDTFSTPFGPFSLAVTSTGALAATAFGNSPTLLSRLPKCHIMYDTSATAVARAQFLDYFSGRRRAFDLPLALHGTPFQQRVWSALLAIPFGETRTYGQLAAQLGAPSAARAVGRANATNPACVIVPCHRVIGANGSLTGFAFGERLKHHLLELERTHHRHAA
jgi:O-6-methylguanine DNA methyltransferase